MKPKEVVFMGVTYWALGAAVVSSFCVKPNSAACYIHSFGPEAPELPAPYSPQPFTHHSVMASGTTLSDVSMRMVGGTVSI